MNFLWFFENIKFIIFYIFSIILISRKLESSKYLIKFNFNFKMKTTATAHKGDKKGSSNHGMAFVKLNLHLLQD